MFSRFNQHYFDLLWAMTIKEFTVRYKQAVFGFLWVILNPLLQMIILGVVFSNFVNIPHYFVFLFSGLLPWQFFSMTLNKVTPSLVYERALLQKSAFAREIIPLSLILSNMLNLLFSIILFIVVLLVISTARLNLVYVVVGLIWLFLFTVGISLMTSALNVRFRDVTFFIQTLTLLWFYLTPILYSLSQLPLPLQQLLSYNPLTAPIGLIQSGLLGFAPPGSALILINLIIGLVVFGTGVAIFIKQSDYFVDWL